MPSWTSLYVYGGQAAAAVAHLDAIALRAWLRFGYASWNGGDQGTDATGGPGQSTGLPSACVPAGRDERTGLPIGVLITGRRLREDLCLEAAEAIEARLGLATPIDPAR
jgi:hypothetical protein